MAKTEETTEEKAPPTLNRIMAQLNKQAGETVVARLGNLEPTDLKVRRLFSDIPQLDEAVGGGFPVGRMVEFYGMQSSGKSLIASKIIANAQASGLDCIYVDAENTFDPEFAAKLGVDIEKLALMQLATGEDVFDFLAKLLEAEPGVIVIDSVAALVTKVEMENSVEKAEMAQRARLMSKGLRKLTAINRKTLIIFINQLRQGIATWGPAPKVTTGGMALPFAASIRIEIARDRDLLYEDGKKSGNVIGQVVQFKVSKNKTFPPFKTGSFKFFYEDSRIE